MVRNERTGKGTLTIINADMIYAPNDFPLITTRKAFWKPAIAEFLGYLRGYTNAADFADIGSPTWFANANENSAWLKNPNRKGTNDMGRVYGAQMRKWTTPTGQNLDQLRKVVNNLSNGIDDRGEILTMWNPGEFELGCLRPCMFMYQFSILDGTLYLNAYQRSCDVPLGLTFNMIQVWFFLYIMAQITGLKMGEAYHKIVNAHIYEDQIDLMKQQLECRPNIEGGIEFKQKVPKFDLDYILTDMAVDDFAVCNYNPHPPIKYPFSV